MTDSVFNIFGDHLAPRPFLSRHLGGNNSENASVGKNAFFSGALTPSKRSINLTPRNVDPKKKTFLQNSGTSFQSYCPEPRSRATLAVYEDLPQQHKSPQPPLSLHDSISVAYTPEPTRNDELNLSDSEMMLSEEHMNALVLGLPSVQRVIEPQVTSPCMHTSTEKLLPLDDFLSDDFCGSSNYPDDIHDDADFPISFE